MCPDARQGPLLFLVSVHSDKIVSGLDSNLSEPSCDALLLL